MNAEQYERQLKRLGFNNSEECAALFKYSKRSAYRWLQDGPPDTVAALLRIAEDQTHLRRLLAKA